MFIQSVAQRENVEKVITLVEKDEVSSWTRVGFVREGTVPGFYKRSDGHLVGCVIGEKTASIEVSDEAEKLTERTVNAAKKASKEVSEQPTNTVTINDVAPKVAARVRDNAWAKGDGLGCFDPFGRDAIRQYIEASPKRGKGNYLSAEYQECFGHSLIEVLRAPKSPAEIHVTYSGLCALSEELKNRGIVSAFGFAPNDNVELATAYAAAGFRKTGLLAKGIMVDGEHKDAILWTRKLADPNGGTDSSNGSDGDNTEDENSDDESKNGS
jgi:hypothetical protein